jgi:hypothetical protein
LGLLWEIVYFASVSNDKKENIGRIFDGHDISKEPAEDYDMWVRLLFGQAHNPSSPPSPRDTAEESTEMMFWQNLNA